MIEAGKLQRANFLQPIPVRQLILVCMCGILLPMGSARSAGPAGGTDVSILEIPLSFDLHPLIHAAEKALPRQTGHWRGWQDWHGIKTRYRAWRGPLQLWMQGPLLRAQAHVRYWAQARKHLLGGLDLSASCGVKEPPRQAVVGLMARLDWAPDWSLHPRFHVLPTRFIDRCEVTVADIDISPLVDKMFEKRLRESLNDAMRAVRPALSGLREQVVRSWQALQLPREIAPGVWLVIQPLGIALAPPQGQGSKLDSALLLALRAGVYSGEAPGVARLPLPPLRPFLPRGAGMRFDLTLMLDYPTLGAHLSAIIAGRAIDLQGQRVDVEAVEVFPRGEDLVLVLTLGGDVAGRLEVMGRPGFDAQSGKHALNDLDFVFDAKDPGQELFVDLFYERVREMLEMAADKLLEEQGGQLRSGVVEALDAILPAGAEIDLSELQPTEVTVRVLPEGMRLQGAATGRARVSLQ